MTILKRCSGGSPNGLASAWSTIAWSFTASRSIATDRLAAPRLNARALTRIAGLAGLFALLAPIHIVTKAALGRSAWPQRFLAAAGWIVGARARCDGEPIRGHTLLVSNHVSWLDILVL